MMIRLVGLILLRLLLHARAGTTGVAAAVTGVAAFAALDRALSWHPHKCGRDAPRRESGARSRDYRCTSWRWEIGGETNGREDMTGPNLWWLTDDSHFRTLIAKGFYSLRFSFTTTTFDRPSCETTLNKDLSAMRSKRSLWSCELKRDSVILSRSDATIVRSATSLTDGRRARSLCEP